MDPVRAQAVGVRNFVWQDACDESGIPRRMLCPISHELMLDPVVASDGYTYDAPMLRHLLRSTDSGSPVSPMTRERLQPVFFPNGELQREIAALLEAHPSLAPELTSQQTAAVQAGQARGIPRHTSLAAVVASHLDDNAGVDAYLSEDLERLVPGPALRRTQDNTDGSLRRFLLLDTSSARPTLRARLMANHSHELGLVTPNESRATLIRRGHALRPRLSLSTPPQAPRIDQGWLEEAPLYRMLAAMYAADHSEADWTQPLLDETDTESVDDNTTQAPDTLDSTHGPADGAERTESGISAVAAPLPFVRALYTPPPETRQHVARSQDVDGTSDAEPGWDPMDWMADEA